MRLALAAVMVANSLSQAGPVLSGGDGTASWVTGRAQGPLTVLTAGREGQPRLVAALAQPDRRFEPRSHVDHWLELDGDPDGRIAVHQLTREYYSQRGGQQRTAGQLLLAGHATGPLTRVSGCMSGEPGCQPRECLYGAGALAPTGTLSLVAGEGEATCLGLPPRLVRRGASNTERYSLEVGQNFLAHLRTAGAYVATAETGPPVTAYCPQNRIVVRAAADGRELWSTTVPLEWCVDSFDVTASGWVVRSLTDNETGERHRVEWVRRGRLITRRAPAGAIAAAGHRTLVATAAALTLVGRDGTRRVVSRFNDAWRRIGDADYDGNYVAWAERRCGAPRVVVTTPDRPRRDPPARCG